MKKYLSIYLYKDLVFRTYKKILTTIKRQITQLNNGQKV